MLSAIYSSVIFFVIMFIYTNKPKIKLYFLRILLVVSQSWDAETVWSCPSDPYSKGLPTTITTTQQLCSTKWEPQKGQSSSTLSNLLKAKRISSGQSYKETPWRSSLTMLRIKVSFLLKIRNSVKHVGRPWEHFLELCSLLCQVGCFWVSWVHDQASVCLKFDASFVVHESAVDLRLHCDPCGYRMGFDQLFLSFARLGRNRSFIHG